MTTENIKKEGIPVDLLGFYDFIIESFRKNSSLVEIEEVADSLVQKKGFERFMPEIPTIRRQLKEFLGPEKWRILRNEEAKRILEGDRAIKGATSG